ncbi:MAG: shikimate kinase [SAR324 cluster bacterium]|nr:shikimate kinase [SAR324 cluster bacterium]
MKNSQRNVVLIGMPGAGKSTIGVILAKQSAHNFVDTDVLIQLEAKRTLQEILDAEGKEGFHKIEERVLLSHHFSNHIIATGGSAVYSEAAMMHLKSAGIAVFLEVKFEELERRLTNLDSRGVTAEPGQTLRELFEERQILYRKYADVVINCDRLSQLEISQVICQQLMLR